MRSFRQKKGGPRLGLLPHRDTNTPRTANIIKPASHEVWKISTGAEFEKYASDCFPQLGQGVISTEEAEQFVQGKPGRFPAPRFVPRLAACVGSTSAFLVGDAAHAFPPDLGQGLNSALEDAQCLEDSLSAGAETAVEAYQTKRGPAAEALCRIVCVGFPYQYNQGPIWREKIFFAGFVLRLGLSKLTRGLLMQPVALATLAGDPYEAIWIKAKKTTLLYKTVVAAAMLGAAARCLRIPMFF
mmetsp:Transcript_9644/g.33883  ORF Transcript_9644/g.33883 Transcript_9644/m.33883 type:complete len:242 (+) Transcript_9644:698-1423(+)